MVSREQLISLGWSIPSIVFYKARLVDRYCLNLVLSWNILFTLSMATKIFAVYCSLDWHLWSLTVYLLSVQDVLAFRVPIEK